MKQINSQTIPDHKQTFKSLFAAFAVILAILPLLAALNSFLTESLNKAGWYKPIQEFIVPWQARMVVVAISPFGITSKVTPGSVYSSFYMVKEGSLIPVYLSWNCLGWQSALHWKAMAYWCRRYKVQSVEVRILLDLTEPRLC